MKLEAKEKTEGPQILNQDHPMSKYLRTERIPHIWCPGCGLGSALTCYFSALDDLGLGLDDIGVVSGIGCTGRVAGYIACDSYHTTHGRAIPFATGLKLGNPDLNVTVFSGDGDLFAIGGNHFIHAARRNIDISVFCINNYNFGMTGGQFGPTTPKGSTATTAPYGNLENPFNLPDLAASSGAVYVARWTTLHARRVKRAMEKAMQKKGFTFVEILSPCPTGYGRRNQLGEGLDELKFYREQTTIKNGSDPADAQIEHGSDSEIILGDFIDIEKPTFTEATAEALKERAKNK